MPLRTLSRPFEAILHSLTEAVEVEAAALILFEGVIDTAHILFHIGDLSPGEWVEAIQTDSSALMVKSLDSVGEASILLALYAPNQANWGQHQHSLIDMSARSLSYLLQPGEDGLDWRQLRASRRILPVTEEELHRIVLDIHDGPVQKIFSALNHVNHLQHLTKRIFVSATTDSLTTLQHVADLLEASLTEIRTFLGTFHPPEFKQRPLLDVLEGLLLQHETLNGSTVYFEASPSLPPVSGPVKIALYRILQEALSNGVRHAQVKEHFVNLWTEAGYLYLEVIDYGPGFEPPSLTGPTATERTEHIGLRGMRDRAELVGGDFELCSQPGQGTRIKVRIPTYE